MTNEDTRKLLLRRSEACDLLSIRMTKLKQLEKDGQIRGLSIGRARRIPRAEIENYIARQLAAQANASGLAAAGR